MREPWFTEQAAVDTAATTAATVLGMSKDQAIAFAKAYREILWETQKTALAEKPAAHYQKLLDTIKNRDLAKSKDPTRVEGLVLTLEEAMGDYLTHDAVANASRALAWEAMLLDRRRFGLLREKPKNENPGEYDDDDDAPAFVYPPLPKTVQDRVATICSAMVTPGQWTKKTRRELEAHWGRPIAAYVAEARRMIDTIVDPDEVRGRISNALAGALEDARMDRDTQAIVNIARTYSGIVGASAATRVIVDSNTPEMQSILIAVTETVCSGCRDRLGQAFAAVRDTGRLEAGDDQEEDG